VWAHEEEMKKLISITRGEGILLFRGFWIWGCGAVLHSGHAVFLVAQDEDHGMWA
jgi:hypothetical protein